MKILIISQSFYPDTFAINDIVQGLVRRGHSVTVLTGLPDYTTSEIPEEYRHGKRRQEELFGARVFRVSTIPRKHGPIWRSLNYLSFAMNGSMFSKKGIIKEFEIIYVWQVSPVTMAIPALFFKRKYKKPLFLYCLDIWPECVKAMGFKEGTFFYTLIAKLSKSIYQRCDHIAVSSEPFFEYLKIVNNCDKTKMSYLPQFASDELLKMDLHKEPNGHYDFLYIGNIGKAQDMHCLVDAITPLQSRFNISFHIIGGGSAFQETKEYAEQTGAAKIIRFYGPMPYKEAIKYYKIADACVLTLDGSNRIGDTLPGKLQTYLAAGKPVLGAMNGAGNEVINQSGSGRCVNAGDSDGLSELFKDFIDNTNAYKEYAVRAREFFAKSFTADTHFDSLMTILNGLVNPINDINI